MTLSTTRAHFLYQQNLYKEGAMWWVLASWTEAYTLSWSTFMDPMLIKEMEKAQAELCPSKPQYPAYKWVCSTGLGTPCSRGRTKECGNSGWEAGQGRAHTSGKFQVTAQAVQWEKSSNALRQGQAATRLRTEKFQLPDSDSKQLLWRGCHEEQESTDRNTSPGLAARVLFPVLQRHDEVYQGCLISIHHWGIIVVQASSHTDMNLGQLYALGTILPQLFSASLQGREYLSNHSHQNQLSLCWRGGKHPFPEKFCWLLTPVKSFTSPCMSRLCHEKRAPVPESTVRVSQTLWNSTGRHKALSTSLFLFHVFLKIVFTNQLHLVVSLT